MKKETRNKTEKEVLKGILGTVYVESAKITIQAKGIPMHFWQSGWTAKKNKL